MEMVSVLSRTAPLVSWNTDPHKARRLPGFMPLDSTENKIYIILGSLLNLGPVMDFFARLGRIYLGREFGPEIPMSVFFQDTDKQTPSSVESVEPDVQAPEPVLESTEDKNTQQGNDVVDGTTVMPVQTPTVAPSADPVREEVLTEVVVKEVTVREKSHGRAGVVTETRPLCSPKVGRYNGKSSRKKKARKAVPPRTPPIVSPRIISFDIE